MENTINTLSKVIEARDPYIAGHQERISKIATNISKKIGFDSYRIEGVRITS